MQVVFVPEKQLLGSETVTVKDALSTTPEASRTLRVAVYVPGFS